MRFGWIGPRAHRGETTWTSSILQSTFGPTFVLVWIVNSFFFFFSLGNFTQHFLFELLPVSIHNKELAKPFHDNFTIMNEQSNSMTILQYKE
jgi:hypothetical protein